MDNVTDFPEYTLDLQKTAANIAHGNIDHCLILTLDENDMVNVYSTTESDELKDQILLAGLGKDQAIELEIDD